MSEGAALVRFHDWRAHGLVAVPVSIGSAILVLAVGQVMILHPAAHRRCRSSAPVVALPDH